MSLGVVTSYYNPERYRSRRRNFELFAAGIEDARMPWLAVESAFDSEEFDLPDGPNIHRVRGGDVMWQKERILNLALARLPRSVEFVAWLDCDLLFENPDWAGDAARRLEQATVLQLFDHVVRLPKGHESFRGPGERWPGCAAIAKRHPQALVAGDFARHGHTGFAWAARRDFLEAHGLYDGCIAGSGDHMMAHAFFGDWDSRCIDRVLCGNASHLRHFRAWCRSVYPSVRARVDFVPGAIYHLWHGETADRRYVLRNRELAGFGFDPDRDIRAGTHGLWEWSSPKPELRAWARDYFRHRREDR
jgi:hypothetical protein